MSISFGLYDFFSYTIPGFLYILVINQFLILFQLPSLPLSKLSTDLGSALFWTVAAFIAGHLMDFFSLKWYQLIIKKKAETKAVSDFHKNLREDGNEFEISDRRVLFSFIRHNDLELAKYIDNYKAISYMLNNISFALILFAVHQMTAMFLEGITLTTTIGFVAGIMFSFIAIRRSRIFNEWYWSAIYEQAHQYGNHFHEMFKASRKKIKK